MKVEFLKSFSKDLDQISAKGIREIKLTQLNLLRILDGRSTIYEYVFGFPQMALIGAEKTSPKGEKVLRKSAGSAGDFYDFGFPRMAEKYWFVFF